MGFKLYDPTYVETLESGVLDTPAAGRLLEDEDFFDVELEDTRGRAWRAERVLFDKSSAVDRPGLIGHGQIHHLECESQVVSSEQDHLWLFFPGDIKIPANARTRSQVKAGRGPWTSSFQTNVWEFTDDGWHFHFQTGRTGLETRLSAASAFPLGIDTRVEEALWFILGTEVQWSAMYRTSPELSKIWLRPIPRLSHPTQAVCDLMQFIGDPPEDP